MGEVRRGQQRTEKVYNEAGARGGRGDTINLIWPDAADQKGQIKKRANTCFGQCGQNVEGGHGGRDGQWW